MNRDPRHQAQGPLSSGRAQAMLLAVLLHGFGSQVLAQTGQAAASHRAGRQMRQKYLATVLRSQIAF